MKTDIISELKERGFLSQIIFEEELIEKLKNEKIVFYFGIDPTADSLHVGHLKSLMAVSLLQKNGHKPIILVGGGTAAIGDPSDRNDMRKMLSKEELKHNLENIKKQLDRFISFEGDNAAIILNNADWIENINLLEYMREICIHFNVNKMLESDCYKRRLETGLTLFEMSYMTLQANDFLYLNNKYNCSMQIGGNDQWPNILAGVDLINKVNNKKAYALGVSLLVNKDGKKMGKTAKGALWLDKEKLSPYDFYQYLINVADEEVEQILKTLTELPMHEIEELIKYKDERMNIAKQIAAYEITKKVHGKEEADKAKLASENAFSKGEITEGVPEISVSFDTDFIDIAIKAEFGKSRGDIKNLVKQGGISLNDKVLDNFNYKIQESDLKEKDGEKYIILKKGKKKFCKVVFQ